MTPADLLAALEQDIEWRDNELMELRRELSGLDTPLEKGKRRAMVPIVQSHAEGFVRFALRAYLRFISSQSVIVGDVREIHAAWMLSREFNRIRVNSVDESFALTGIDTENKKAKQHYSEARFLEALGELLEQQVMLDESSLDQFDQNLSSPYLLALLYHCGLDPTPHSSYAGKLNGLVIRRNQIAHGENSAALVSEIDMWMQTVRELFSRIRDEVFTHASRQLYLKTASAPSIPEQI